MKYIFIITIFLSLSFLSKAQTPEFDSPVDLGIADTNLLNEVSGIAASIRNQGIFWVHNDDGSNPRIYAINTKAIIVAVFYIDIKSGRDWEDIAVGPGPKYDESYIYIGDIGDNNIEFDKKHIYRFKEPFVDENQQKTTDTIRIYDKITFKYPDKIHDAEALMLDPVTKDLFIVSKRLQNEKVFRLAFPQSTDKTITAEYIATVPYGYEGFTGSGVTAADIASSGTEIFIKTYAKVYYYKRNPGQTIAEALFNKPAEVNYKMEPQGEAICWHPQSKGYYTISEMSPFNVPAHLYFYPRKAMGVKKKK